MENNQKIIKSRVKKPSIFKKFFSFLGFGDRKDNHLNDHQLPIANDRNMWIPDEKAQTCYNCRKEFSAIFLRKHHCRICGNVFCKECSSKNVEGKYWGSKKEIKVCDYCCEMYEKLEKRLIETTVDNHSNLVDDINSINDNIKNLKRETKLSEYCKYAKRDNEECQKFLQMDKKFEETIKLNLENYFDFLLRQIIDNVFQLEGLNVRWIDKIFELTKKAIFQINPSFRDLKDELNVNKYIKIKTILHKDHTLSKVIDGFAFQKNVCAKNMTSTIENPKILLLDCGLDYYRNNDNITDFENLKLQEPAYFEIIIKKIELVEPNLILVNKNISRKIQEYLSRSNKISLVLNVQSKSLKNIARCTKTYVLPSTDLIDKQTILGTCKKFRVEKIKSSAQLLNNNTSNYTSHNLQNLNNLTNLEEVNFKNTEILNKLKSGRGIININNSSCNKTNMQDIKKPQNEGNPGSANFDNLKSNDYNLMIFEGCDNLLFCTIILYGPDKTELKKLKKTLRGILITARDLFLQQSLLYYFYADIVNLNDAFHFANSPRVDHINNQNLQFSFQSIMTPIYAKQEKNNLITNNSMCSLNPLNFNNNINISNIIYCAMKLAGEYSQLSQDYFFGFDKNNIYEEKTKLSVVQLIISQGNYIQNINFDKFSIISSINPSSNLNKEFLDKNGNLKSTNFPGNLNFNYELPEKEILESINFICDEPEDLDLIFYSKKEDFECDKPLGKLILDLCGESETKCDSCKKPKYNHIYYIFKKTGRLKIQMINQNQDDSVEKIMESINRDTTDFIKYNNYNKSDKEKNIYLNSNSGINNYNLDIYSYGYCKICKCVVTPLIKLTRELFNYSVAKYFKFMLFNHDVKNRSQNKIEFNLKKHSLAKDNCSHFINKDIYRVFITKLGTIKFTYENSPLYIIETSPIHESKNKKYFIDVLVEYVNTSKEKSLELIEILKNNLKILTEEFNSESFKIGIITIPLSTVGSEKKEIREYTEKALKICQKYSGMLQEINNFIDLVFIPAKFKNYLKSISIIKKIYFRIIQIKGIVDKIKEIKIKMKKLIEKYSENKYIFLQKPENCENNVFNTNINLNSISISSEKSSSSGFRDNQNLNKDLISQLNMNYNNQLIISNNNPLKNTNLNNNIQNIPNQEITNLNNTISSNISSVNNYLPNTNLLNPNTSTEYNLVLNNNSNFISLENIPNTHQIPYNINNPSSNLIQTQETKKYDEKCVNNNTLKENQSVIFSKLNSINFQNNIIIEDNNICKSTKINNEINIENKDCYKSVLNDINFFDESNHKFCSSDISSNDVASIISYTLTSDAYRDCISPSNRFKLLDIKCKRHRKEKKDFKEVANNTNPNGPIYNRINSINTENFENNEIKYGYFFTTQDMEVYDTSLLFDQMKNNYTYLNLDNHKINQQLETELLSDDKSHFIYVFTNNNLMTNLTGLNLPVEYINTNYDPVGPKKSKITSKNLISNIGGNFNSVLREKEKEFQKESINSNILNNSNVLINLGNNNSLLNSGNLNSNNLSSVNNKNEINENDNFNISMNVTNNVNNFMNGISHTGPHGNSDEKIILGGDDVKKMIEEIDGIKKDLKIFRNQNLQNLENKTKPKKKPDVLDENEPMEIEVSVYYHRQFEALRITYCATYNDFILSVKNLFIFLYFFYLNFV